MKKKIQIIMSVCLSLIFICNCSESGTEPEDILPASNLNFNDHIYPLFSAKCSSRSGCHTISNPAANLPLTDYNEVITHYMSNAPSEPLIHPDNGDISPLYQILIQDGYLGVPRMPFNGPYLNSNQYDGVKTWIDEGANP
jgi:hypothetical protein